MTRTSPRRRPCARCIAVIAGVIAVVLPGAARWPAVAQSATPAMTPVPKYCETSGAVAITGSPLPRVAAALKERKSIRILAIGGSSVSRGGGRAASGPYERIESFLESNFKGLDVEIVDRGVSGELAANAGERIKTEVGLNDIDLVLWQLGTADAMAGVAPDDLRQVITETSAWLKDHNVDLILIGMRFSAQLVGDAHYQATRRTIREVATSLGLLRLGRYEAEETFARIRSGKGQDLTEVEVTEAPYVCMAEYLARSIAAGLFARQSPPRPSAPGQLGQPQPGEKAPQPSPPAPTQPPAAPQPATPR